MYMTHFYSNYNIVFPFSISTSSLYHQTGTGHWESVTSNRSKQLEYPNKMGTHLRVPLATLIHIPTVQN